MLNVEFEWDKELPSVKIPVLGPPPLITTDTVKGTINKMKGDKAAGCYGVVAEKLKASDKTGVRLFTELINSIIKEEMIPDDWQRSAIISIIQDKGNFLGLIV